MIILFQIIFHSCTKKFPYRYEKIWSELINTYNLLGLENKRNSRNKPPVFVALEEDDERIVEDLGLGRKLVNICGKTYTYVDHHPQQPFPKHKVRPTDFYTRNMDVKRAEQVLQDLESNTNDDEDDGFMNLHEADNIMLADLIREKTKEKSCAVSVCLFL